MPRPGPTPPPHFDPDAGKLWYSAYDRLKAQGTWQDIDRHLLALFVRAVIRAEEFRAELAETGYTTKGSQGQLVQHPSVKMLREAEQDARGFADSLLLSPGARRRARLDDGGDTKDSLTAFLT